MISVPSIVDRAARSACRGRRGCASASTCPSRTGPLPRSARPARPRGRRRGARRRRSRPRRSGASRRAPRPLRCRCGSCVVGHRCICLRSCREPASGLPAGRRVRTSRTSPQLSDLPRVEADCRGRVDADQQAALPAPRAPVAEHERDERAAPPIAASSTGRKPSGSGWAKNEREQHDRRDDEQRRPARSTRSRSRSRASSCRGARSRPRRRARPRCRRSRRSLPR